ncbi:hypothetical protein B0H94_108130 [Salsuginibacillus halophilus]|uniref:Pyrroline-5-carboxylate reductase catalytic N-terminal domain-containing protein n=1 Tax=Salsuginibacillus halophilus TaxID=517424 RepID=A0A2P8HE66_9BACI|nr:hypothetical protein [Salsuginibacillus halophilus]PSL44517.1 hypothetical protein B0H94_108130 [Salsuginibacillus halophilus]
MLVVGYGRLGQLMAHVFQTQPAPVFNRTRKHVDEASNAVYVGPEDFAKHHTVFLALPPTAYESFFQTYGPYFAEETMFFHMATACNVEEAAAIASPFSVVPLKLAGHAETSLQADEAVFALPAAYQMYQAEVKSALNERAVVVEAEESDVREGNMAVTKAVILMMRQLEKTLEEEGVANELHRGILRTIPSGVAAAYMENKLGGFARKIIEEEDRKQGSDNDAT